jgi:predicted nucleic acid-binding protein
VAIYLLDTNLYVRATRDPAVRARLRRFYAEHAGELAVSAIVLFELYLGARDEVARAAVDREVFRPFADRRRLLLPDLHVWRLAAQTMVALTRRGAHSARLDQRSFLNDVLIAATARRLGATLLTANGKDFALIRTALAFSYSTEWP